MSKPETPIFWQINNNKLKVAYYNKILKFIILEIPFFLIV